MRNEEFLRNERIPDAKFLNVRKEILTLRILEPLALLWEGAKFHVRGSNLAAEFSVETLGLLR
ncbi:MAG: hypothetical protein HW374_299 [Bacteroidetes bacterium]|nr:hypothetical protein [Bacteroidota bacterium]